MDPITFQLNIFLSGRVDVYHHSLNGNKFDVTVGPFVERKQAQMAPPVITVSVLDNQKFLLKVNGVRDGLGNTIPFSGTPVLTADDPASLLVSPGDDGATPPTQVQNSFWVEPVQSPGHLGLFTGTLTDGVTTNAVSITVGPGPEVADSGFDVTIGDPVPIAPASPDTTGAVASAS